MTAPACYYLGKPDYHADQRRSGKYYSGPVKQTPNALPKPIVGENQVEGHTCGMHSVSAVYKSYGVDPELADLRFRMGADRMANPLDKTSLGTVQPDMLRVVHQDGFATALLDLQDPEPAQKRLRDHLDSGHYAVTLISRREGGGLH